MSLAQLSQMPLGRRVHAILARCHHLLGVVCNPYRPELHYMRRPGPKWRARHQLSRHGNL
jgi:hypothetical protein